MAFQRDWRRVGFSGVRIGAAALAALLLLSGLPRAAPDPQLATALQIAELLRAARAVISANQDRINDPNLGDKGLTGDVVVAQAMAAAAKASGADLAQADPKSRQGQLLIALEDAIRQVMTINQDLINQKDIGFKGFVPAVFGRLVTEQFRHNVARKADIKITAPPHLVRNRRASPDVFEKQVIRDKFSLPSWPKGQLYSAVTNVNGRPALRVLVPEYYSAGCLACHGEPKGQIDITGYPKEGAKLGDLGGVISIAIYR